MLGGLLGAQESHAIFGINTGPTAMSCTGSCGPNCIAYWNSQGGDASYTKGVNLCCKGTSLCSSADNAGLVNACGDAGKPITCTGTSAVCRAIKTGAADKCDGETATGAAVACGFTDDDCAAAAE